MEDTDLWEVVYATFHYYDPLRECTSKDVGIVAFVSGHRRLQMFVRRPLANCFAANQKSVSPPNAELVQEIPASHFYTNDIDLNANWGAESRKA
eukprot:scaffold14699_cov170-Amphora_coffeaeformis.AAC.1